MHVSVIPRAEEDARNCLVQVQGQEGFAQREGVEKGEPGGHAKRSSIGSVYEEKALFGNSP